MPRFGLAFRCFFGLLFKGKLPERAADYLPEITRPPALPEAKPEADAGAEPDAKTDANAEVEARAEPAPQDRAHKPKPAEEPARKPEPVRKPPSDAAEQHREGALALLALMQREGRLVDFLQESLDEYDDGDIGDVNGEPPFKGVLRHHGWRVTRATFPSLSEGVDRHVLAPAEVEVS